MSDAKTIKPCRAKWKGSMTDRERFNNQMHYKPVDRCPICDFGFWDEIPGFWQKEGLPEGISAWELTDFFGMDRYEHAGVGIGSCMRPWFKSRVIEDRGDTVVVVGNDGVRTLAHKTMSSIPIHLGHLLREGRTQPAISADASDRIEAEEDVGFSFVRDFVFDE